MRLKINLGPLLKELEYFYDIRKIHKESLSKSTMKLIMTSEVSSQLIIVIKRE